MWKEENNRLIKTFKFHDFKEAFGFMTKVALVAEKMHHHIDGNACILAIFRKLL